MMLLIDENNENSKSILERIIRIVPQFNVLASSPLYVECTNSAEIQAADSAAAYAVLIVGQYTVRDLSILNYMEEMVSQKPPPPNPTYVRKDEQQTTGNAPAESRSGAEQHASPGVANTIDNDEGKRGDISQADLARAISSMPTQSSGDSTDMIHHLVASPNAAIQDRSSDIALQLMSKRG